uniref:Uncharacterized protein n=1 Tax=Arundo donax TaxID=35708 RepID=A0A0A9C9R2_ARUDO
MAGQVSRASQLFLHFLSIPIGDAQSYCVETR